MDSLDGTLIADLDGKGIDDIIRYNGSNKTWEVSVGARTSWQPLATQDPRTITPYGIYTY